MSLDGYVSGPTDEGEIFAAIDDFTDSERYNMALLEHVDVALLGRRSYESFVQMWPTSEDEPMAELVNNVPKVVCSTTLKEAPWGRYAAAQVVRDAARYVRDLKSTGGGDVLIWGSINLMRSLLRERLVDELDIFIAPVALGRDTSHLHRRPLPADPDPGRCLAVVNAHPLRSQLQRAVLSAALTQP